MSTKLPTNTDILFANRVRQSLRRLCSGQVKDRHAQPQCVVREACHQRGVRAIFAPARFTTSG